MQVETQDNTATIADITPEELEIIHEAVMAYLNYLPPDKQPQFRRLAMDMDKYLNQNHNENHFRQSPILSPSDGTANQLQGKP